MASVQSAVRRPCPKRAELHFTGYDPERDAAALWTGAAALWTGAATLIKADMQCKWTMIIRERENDKRGERIF